VYTQPFDLLGFDLHCWVKQCDYGQVKNCCFAGGLPCSLAVIIHHGHSAQHYTH
jgi:hypothetical protein